MRLSKNRRADPRTVELCVSSDSTCPGPRTAKLPLRSRRRNFLAGSAFTGGVFALMMAANPQSAWAAGTCTINNSTGGAGTIECSGTFGTNSNTTNPITGTHTNSTSTVRDQSFNDAFSVGPGASGYAIDPGTAITGYGLSIDNTVSNAPITIVNSGNVSVTTGGAALAGANSNLNANGAALNINGDGGTITYSGNGNATGGTGSNYDGIDIANTGPGAVIVGGNGTTAFPGNPVTPELTGATGLGISTVDGDQNVFLQNGTISVTSADGRGIFQDATTGNVNLTITGGATISSTVASSGIFGIEAETSGAGSVSVASSATMGAPLLPFTEGIDAASDISVGGNTTVVQTGGIIYATVTGIDASGAGAVAVTTNLGSQIAMGTGDTPSGTAISANSSQNSVTVTINGLIDEPVDGVFATGAGDVTVTQNTPNLVTTDAGVIAESFGTGNVTVSGTGSIEGDGNKTGGGLYQGAIFALQTGTLGSVLVGGLGTTVSANGVGIDAEIGNATNNGSIVVDRSGTVTAGLTGILAATNGGGNVTVNTYASVTAGNASVGIEAVQLALQLGGNGDVTVTTGGAVTGGLGIFASTAGNGQIIINSSAGAVVGDATGNVTTATQLFGTILNVPAADADGIFALNHNGNITIITGAVSSTSANGIEAETGVGTPIFPGDATANGAITIVTGGAVSGAAGNGTVTFYGILADQNQSGVPSGNISITTGGTVIAGTGIAAIAQDNANITINSSAGQVTGNGSFIAAVPGSGDGIFAQSVNGAIGITTGAVTSTNGDGIEATSSAGAISLTTGAVSSTNGNGIEAESVDGAVTILTKGAVTGNATSGFGILVDAGDVNITTGSSVTGATGISAVANNPANSSVTINTTAGTVSGTFATQNPQGIGAGDGIFAVTVNGPISITTGAVSSTANNGIEAETGLNWGPSTATANGAITIATQGNVDGGAGNATQTQYGILAQQNDPTATSSGNISITTGGEVIAGTGIAAFAQTGANITINSSAGNVTGNGSVIAAIPGSADGINAFGIGGAISITTAAVSGEASGIVAVTSGGGNVTVNTGAAVTAGNTSLGIGAVQFGGNGDVAVTTGGAVTGGAGILAEAQGNGRVTVNSSAGLVTGTGTAGVGALTPFGAIGASGDGIAAFTLNGAIGITTGAVTSTYANGIAAETGVPSGATSNGAITIATQGNVDGGAGNATQTQYGILAQQNDPTATSSGNISITTGGTVTGGTGIAAFAQTGANITINSSAGNVTGNGSVIAAIPGSADGINAFGIGGAISITTAAVSGEASGIVAVTSGGGNVTVNTGAAVTAGNTSLGIGAVQFGGNGDVAVTTGGAVTGGAGILAEAQGNGRVTVNLSAGLVTGTGTAGVGALTPFGAIGASGDGIAAFTLNGAIGITTGAVTSTYANGIAAETGVPSGATSNGAITILTKGAVSGATGNATTTFYGIWADQNQSGVSSGNISITTGGTVTGGHGRRGNRPERRQHHHQHVGRQRDRQRRLY